MKLLVFISALGFPCASSWGPDGHKIVAQIASGMLSFEELSNLRGLLGGEHLADIATWADQARREPAYSWSEPLHYLNNRDGTCTFTYEEACKDDRCVAGAIVNYTRIAMDHNSSAHAKNEALHFVVHFVGDIHQPLHCGWASDRGGNLIDVEEGFDGNTETKLHAVWDYGIIDRIESDGGYDWLGYEAELSKKIASTWSANSTLWSMCFASISELHQCVEKIAQESITAACASAYYDDHGKKVYEHETLDEGYYTTRSLVVSERLAAGGVRLGALLRQILSGAVPEAQLV